VARQAWQICRGTWRLNTGQRANPGRTLVSQESGAHTVSNVRLFQTLAAAETADNGVELSAEASRVVTGIRSASRSYGVRVRCGRHSPGPMPPMAYEWHLGVTTPMNGSQSASVVASAGENAPAEVDLARTRAERGTSPRGQERISSQSRIKKPRRRRIRRSAVAPVQGVTAPDLPEGI
jgi:hypothetical protein